MATAGAKPVFTPSSIHVYTMSQVIALAGVVPETHIGNHLDRWNLCARPENLFFRGDPDLPLFAGRVFV